MGKEVGCNTTMGTVVAVVEVVAMVVEVVAMIVECGRGVTVGLAISVWRWGWKRGYGETEFDCNVLKLQMLKCQIKHVHFTELRG